jgi:hypothetical protein
VHGGRYSAVNLNGDVALWSSLKWVETDDLVGLGEVQQNDFSLQRPAGAPIQDTIVKAAVRVDETKTLSGLDVLPHKVFEEFRFTATTAADYVHVTSPLFFVEMKRSAASIKT